MSFEHCACQSASAAATLTQLRIACQNSKQASEVLVDEHCFAFLPFRYFCHSSASTLRSCEVPELVFLLSAASWHMKYYANAFILLSAKGLKSFHD